MAAKLTIPFPSASSREMSAPSRIKHLTADSPPELAARRRGVERILKKSAVLIIAYLIMKINNLKHYYMYVVIFSQMKEIFKDLIWNIFIL